MIKETCKRRRAGESMLATEPITEAERRNRQLHILAHRGHRF